MGIYRHISHDELNALKRGETIFSRDHDQLFVLTDEIEGIIIPDKYNYKIDLNEYESLKRSYPNVTLSKEDAYDIMIGTISDDCLIELKDVDVVGYALGWYYHSENEDGSFNEFCLKETLIAPYSMKNVEQIIWD